MPIVPCKDTICCPQALATFSLRRIWAIFGEPTQFSPAWCGDAAHPSLLVRFCLNHENYLRLLTGPFRIAKPLKACVALERTEIWPKPCQIPDLVVKHVVVKRELSCKDNQRNTKASNNESLTEPSESHQSKNQCFRPVSSLYKITPHAKMSERGEYLCKQRVGADISLHSCHVLLICWEALAHLPA